jgi:hypothetical protein
MIFYTKKTMIIHPDKHTGEYKLDPVSKEYILIEDNSSLKRQINVTKMIEGEIR